MTVFRLRRWLFFFWSSARARRKVPVEGAFIRSRLRRYVMEYKEMSKLFLAPLPRHKTDN